MANCLSAADDARWIRRAAWGVLALLVFGAAIHYSLKAAENASAIVRWRGLIQHLVHGENVYGDPAIPGMFPNPPVLAVVLWPLTLLPPVPSAVLWFGIKVVMAGWSVYWSVRLATGDEFSLPTWSLVILLMLAGRPLASDLDHGNVNILILFLATAGLWAYRNSRDWLAGSAIALATAFKLTPALFIPYFAYKRQWRVVAWSVVGLLVFLLVLPGPVLGFRRNLWLVRAWSGAMVVPYVFQGKIETMQVNQSLPGIWMRLVTDSPGVKLADDSAVTVNFLSLDHQTALWILKALIVGLLLVVAWLARTPAANRRDLRMACEYALIFITMLLISERSWKHHYVSMVLPYAVIIAHCSRATCSRAMARYVWCSLVASFLLMASTSSELGGWFLAGAGHKYAQGYGLFGASGLVVMLAVAVVLRSASNVGRRNEQEETEATELLTSVPSVPSCEIPSATLVNHLRPGAY